MRSEGQDWDNFPDVVYVCIPRSHTPHGSVYWDDVTEPSREDYVFHVEYNHMHDYGLGILSDFGAVYIGLSLIPARMFAKWLIKSSEMSVPFLPKLKHIHNQ